MDLSSKKNQIEINGKNIGAGNPTYIVAEMSGNHNQDISNALEIINMSKECGADAVKLQTYTADTLTIDCDNDAFIIKRGLWKGRKLYDLYTEASTPWEWHERLKEEADKIGIDLFSSPFDETAVDLLETLNVPAYKIASFEMTDHTLLRYVAKTGKPIIMSTGMASLSDINDSIGVVRSEDNEQLIVLHCVSGYPTPTEEMNLKTIPHLSETFDLCTGLSDHSEGIASSVAAVALGACLIEKHVTMSRSSGGPDSEFSLEPNELEDLVKNIRQVEKAIGKVNYDLKEKEKESLVFRRSLFAVEDIGKGEYLTKSNVKSIRPGYGLAPKHLEDIIGLKAGEPITRGTPITWKILSG